MKYLSILICIFLWNQQCFAQQWIWVTPAHGFQNSQQAPWGLTIDKTNGFVYSTGTYRLNFTIGTYSFVDSNGMNYITKLDTAGNLIWANALQANCQVVSSNNDSIFLAGNYVDPKIIMGVDTLINFDTTGFTEDCLVALFDGNYNLQWMQKIHGAGEDEIFRETVDENHNVYVAGVTSSHLTIFGNDTFNNPAQHSVFFIKYNHSGDIIWLKTFPVGDVNVGETRALTYDSGFVYMVLLYSIIKFDTNGNTMWQRSLGTGSVEQIAMTTDKSHQLYITGNLNPGTSYIGNDTLINNGPNTSDVFIAKMNSSGDIIWAKRYGNDDEEMSWDIAIDSKGRLVVAGQYDFFQSQLPLNVGNYTLNPPANSVQPLFLITSDTSGGVINALGLNGGGNGCRIVTDNNNGIYFTGTWDVSASNISIGNYNQPVSGDREVIFAKYSNGALIIPTTVVPTAGCNAYPNPSNGTFTISGNLPASQSMAFELRDVRGAAVYKTNLYLTNGTLKKEISLKALPPGLYMYTYLTNTGESGSGKLVIQKE
jgi:hypothetical protein